MPLLLLSSAVFLATVSVTAILLFRMSGGNQARFRARLSVERQLVSAFVPSPSLVWWQLLERVGSVMPVNSQELSKLKRLLVRAGFRNPQAARLFRGARVLSIATFLFLGLCATLQFDAFRRNFVVVMVTAGMLGRLAPLRYLGFRTRRRKRAIEKGLPNALDLMVVCVEAGLGLDQTILQVAKELQFVHGEICEEFTLLNIELRAGKRRAEALHNLADRTAVEDLRKLVAVLIQTDKFGTSIAPTLPGHAEYMRAMARQRAEEKASKLPVKLVFPIFFCVLPSLFVVALGPVLARLVQQLLPMMENP